MLNILSCVVGLISVKYLIHLMLLIKFKASNFDFVIICFDKRYIGCHVATI